MGKAYPDHQHIPRSFIFKHQNVTFIIKMKFSTILTLVGAAVASPVIEERQETIDPLSASLAVFNALPTSLRDMALTNPAAVVSAIASDFATGTPTWFRPSQPTSRATSCPRLTTLVSPLFHLPVPRPLVLLPLQLAQLPLRRLRLRPALAVLSPLPLLMRQLQSLPLLAVSLLSPRQHPLPLPPLPLTAAPCQPRSSPVGSLVLLVSWLSLLSKRFDPSMVVFGTNRRARLSETNSYLL